MHPLPGAEPGRKKSIDLRRAILVESSRELRTVDLSHPDQRRQRHWLARGVAHVEPADIVGVGPELALGLDVYLPHSSVLVEVVHEGSSERSEERRVGKECRCRGWREP